MEAEMEIEAIVSDHGTHSNYLFWCRAGAKHSLLLVL